MKHYDWPEKLRLTYDKALDFHKAGGRDPDAFLTPNERDELATIGLVPINVFDYAEDCVKHGEPSWEAFLLVAAARRDYFLYELDSKLAPSTLSEADLPSKKEALEGFVWLPRIVQKARAFLRGTLPKEIMYGCGGDRNFLQTHDLHLGEFLRMVWACESDTSKLLKFLKK